MRIAGVPENLAERIASAAGIVPTPLLDTLGTLWLARAIMAGTSLGVFEALAAGPLDGNAVAGRCGTHPAATVKLLNALVGARYLRTEDGRYALAPVARRWLLRGSEPSLHDSILFRYMEWDVIAHYEEFVRTGKPLRLHEGSLGAEQWELYQRGMRSLAGLSAPEIARRTPVPKGARTMLDIGGSHGLYSVALCRRHAGLRAVILDLPEAVTAAAPILAREGMGERVVHRTGNALTDDLGTEAWDTVFTGNLVHHFDDATNREFARRVVRALRPGGTFVILEVIRPASPGEAGQLGALGDLYFALTSESGTWSFEEMADWQRAAGLAPRAPIRLRSIPGAGIQAADKRA